MTKRLAAAVLVAGVVFGGATDMMAGRVVAARPCTASFQNTGVEGITDEGKGTYSDGLDGTQCTVNTADTGGDLLFTLNYTRAKTSRSALLFLNRPVNGSLDRGLWVLTSNFHIHLASIGQVPVGTSIVHQVSFHVPYGGSTYKLHFGWDGETGTTVALVTHASEKIWTITPVDAAAVGRLWTGGGFGDPTVYAALGDYYVPFTLTVTLK